MSQDFEPDSLKIEEVDKISVRLVLEKDDGNSLGLILRRSQLPQLAALLLGESVLGSGAPISLEDFRSGQDIRVTGFRFLPRANQFGLRLLVELSERFVIVPLTLSKSEVVDCVTEMTKWLRTQPT